MNDFSTMPEKVRDCSSSNAVLNKVHGLFGALIQHDGFGEIRIEMRVLKRGQKEVILHCGKQFRFVLDPAEAGGTDFNYSCCCDESRPVLKKLHELYYGLLRHNGFGEIRIEMRIYKKTQKEVILHCGKQYRFLLDIYPGSAGAPAAP